MLGAMVGTGYYTSYLIEYGIKCLGSIVTDWLLLAILFGVSLVLLLICWIYLVFFRTKTKQPFQEKV
jgi:hypothetical protein